MIFNIFIKINKEYIDYINTIYNKEDIQNNLKSKLDFVMLKNFNNLNEIETNCNFIKKDRYDKNIICLKNNTLFCKLIYWWNYNFISNILNNSYTENEIIFCDQMNYFAIYSLKKNNYSNYTNINDNKFFIQVHLPQPNSYQIIKKNLINNYIIINNILSNFNINIKELNQDNLSNYNYNKLFEDWIRPIEPNDEVNFKKLLLVGKIDEDKIEIDGEVYNDILCFRNFIQSDYLHGLKIFYPNINNNDNIKYLQMPLLFTTYRINEKGQIMLILH